MSTRKLSGKIALVTGGSKGYGKGIAAKLGEHGAVVWITGRKEDELKAAASELGCHWFKADVASAEDWDRLVATVIKAQGRLDILVNNAGGGCKISECDQQTPESIAETIAINLTGSILGCRLAAGIMKKQRSGTIINISSICARQAWPGWGIYSAAKAGVVQFGKSLYLELRPYGVRVTSIIPSWGATSFNINAHLPAFDKKTAEKSIQPGEMGDLVLSVCELPASLCIQDVTILPLIQEINPL